MTTILEDGTKEYWQTVRTFTTQVVESGIPSSTGFVTIDWGMALPDEVEIRFDELTTTGSPTSVLFDVWRVLNGKTDRLYRVTYDSADYTAPIPFNLKFDGSQIYVTVTFTAGTSPTVTTVCQQRVIS